MFSSRSPAGQAAQRLAGHRIEIATAASGIDKAAAQLFMAEGARVALLDLLGNGLADMLAGADSFSGAVDITGETEVEQALAEADERLGGIDGVVNAAGIMLSGAMADVPAAVWRRQIDVNLTGSSASRSAASHQAARPPP